MAGFRPTLWAGEMKQVKPHSALALAVALICGGASAQTTSSSGAPIPDAATLIHQVRDHQQKMDALLEKYTYHEVEATQELDKNGQVKKTETNEYDVFFVNSHEIQRLVRKDGKDLSPDEQDKEQKRVVKEIDKAEKTPPGQAPDHDTVSVARLLAIMKLSAPRRVELDGRGTLVFGFVGDPHAQTHGLAENASKKIAGTLWVDEQDREVRRLNAHFDDNFRMGWGLASVSKGSTFDFDQEPVGGTLWLPSSAAIHLVAHAVGFLSYRAEIHVTDTDYKVFHVSSQQSGAQVVRSEGPK